MSACGSTFPRSGANPPWEPGFSASPRTSVCVRASGGGGISQTTISAGIPAEEPGDDASRVQALYGAVAELPEMDRLMISLYLEELKQSEIARITGVSEANVRVRIHRIKAALAKKITQE